MRLPVEVSELGRAMLDEMELQKGVGPFLTPVDLEEVPDYAIIIAKPIDLGTIRSRVDDNWSVVHAELSGSVVYDSTAVGIKVHERVSSS